MGYDHVITQEPGKRGGRPCIRGTRIAVADILGWLAAGMSHDDIIADFPELTENDIRAASAFAADRERRIGFMAGKIKVPDDFDSLGEDEIERRFTADK